MVWLSSSALRSSQQHDIEKLGPRAKQLHQHAKPVVPAAQLLLQNPPIDVNCINANAGFTRRLLLTTIGSSLLIPISSCRAEVVCPPETKADLAQSLQQATRAQSVLSNVNSFLTEVDSCLAVDTTAECLQLPRVRAALSEVVVAASVLQRILPTLYTEMQRRNKQDMAQVVEAVNVSAPPAPAEGMPVQVLTAATGNLQSLVKAAERAGTAIQDKGYIGDSLHVILPLVKGVMVNLNSILEIMN